MIKSLLKKSYQRFAARYDYDPGYMFYVTDTSTSAGIRLSFLPLFSQYSGPVDARDVWAGAVLGSTLDGDCGPCVQLVLDMAVEAGIPPDHLTLCLEGQPAEAGDVGLGFRFAQAAIADEPHLEELRAEIEHRFGPTAVIAASFAASSGRVYPVMKRGLGFGGTCSQAVIGGEMIRIAHRT